MQGIGRKKKYLIFALTIVGIGLTCGLIFYQFLSSDLKISIADTLGNYSNFGYNAIFKDLIIMSLLLVLSFFVIGIPFSIFYLLYEGFSLGFLINIFFGIYGIKGLIYSLLYISINKALTFILIILFIQKIINISRHIIGIIIYKKDELIKEKLIINFQNSLYIIVFVFLINILLYYLSPYIFQYFAFLIK